MRISLAAAVGLCAGMLTVAVVYAAASNAASSPAQTQGTVPSTADSTDAAVKHAKLTQCLKEAKDRKLVGAAKTAFVKECTARP